MVFIGQSLDQDLITRTLNTALLDDAEWVKWEKVRYRQLQADRADSSAYELAQEGREEDGEAVRDVRW